MQFPHSMEVTNVPCQHQVNLLMASLLSLLVIHIIAFMTSVIIDTDVRVYIPLCVFVTITYNAGM